jgi:uncharacterized membrane protein/disulfide oxidoreductase YuzD
MIRRIAAFLLVGTLFLLQAFPVRADEASVRAVLFYNPNCGHCTYVLNDVLPPLSEQYGNQFQYLPIDITRKDGETLYQSAIKKLSIPEDQLALPLLVIEDTYLAGQDEVTNQLPQIIEDRLAQGGTEWPSIPGLDKYMQNLGYSSTPASSWDKFLADQPANSLAVIVLIGLILSLIFSNLITFRRTPTFLDSLPVWVFPLLLVIGLFVASYLTYTESTQSQVFCGGISHCTEVQNSQYSKLFGLISVGEFGVLGYLLIGISWLVHRIDRGWLHTASAIAMFGFAVFGVCFSIYLTFLEPFVIGATCLWCLTSAIIMGLLFPLTTIPVREAICQYPHPELHIPAE